MISIVITHHQTPVLLKLCLKSIEENIGELEYEITVIDSKAELSTQYLIEEEFPKVRYLSFTKNIGYAKIVNEGIKTSNGEYILILNADIIITKNSISKLLEFIQSNPQVGLVGPQLIGFNNRIQNSSFRFPTIRAILARRTFISKLKWGKKIINQFLMEEKNSSNPKPVDWLQGSVMLVRQAAIKKIGLMDERFFMYLEDTDWCRRFWQNNYQVIYLPTAQMYHYYGRPSKKLGSLLDILFNKQARIHLISASKYFLKWRNQKV